MSLNPTKLLLGIAAPFIAAGAAWLTAAAAKYGIHLDQSGINAFGVAGATAGAAVMVKLIHDVETKSKVLQVVGAVTADAAPVLAAVETADPAAKPMLEDMLAQAQRAMQAKFDELVAKLPQPAAPAPAPLAPTPVAVADPPVPMAHLTPPIVA
jgi:hypothetical protein